MSKQIVIRSSSVGDFKACPLRYRYKYEEGLTTPDTEATRMGTSWHGLQEVYRIALAEETARLLDEVDRGGGDDCIPERAAEVAMDAAIEHLNERYAECPHGVELEKWETERTILLYSFIAYLWYYQADEIETLATEFGFTLPLHHPKTGLPLRIEDVIRNGTIDKIVRINGIIAPADYKSTSKAIDADSQFWGHLALDTQISMYVMALQELHGQGELRQFGVGDDEVVAGAFYDVWHKPTIKPKALTQKDTAALIETGEYMGQKFGVECVESGDLSEAGVMTSYHAVSIDGAEAVVTEGKKGFAVRETSRMFGARLLTDIQERPEFYFARREIPRTTLDISKFRGELYNVYQSMKSMRDSGHWFGNERQCEATFKCSYIPICYTGLDVLNGHTPEGMTRETTELTVERKSI